MKIAIHQPAGFNEAGGRSNNEDSIFPFPGNASVSDRLFLVCDGVGGEHKGEIASAMACSCMHHYFSTYPVATPTLDYIKQAVEFTRQSFENTEKEDSGTHGMATTLTLLNLTDNGVVVAHLGDSRVYQVRNGKIIFRTKDHKWVNELVEGGLITEEQARTHPKRNVITKVIGAARNDQPDYTLISEVLPGDYFFMCTDGVLEQLYDELLEYHLRVNDDNPASPSEIIETIREECVGKTNDNFSAYLIRIDPVPARTLAVPESRREARTVVPAFAEPDHRSMGSLYTIATIIAVLVFGSVAYYFMRKPSASPPESLVKSSVLIADTTSAASAVFDKTPVPATEKKKLPERRNEERKPVKNAEVKIKKEPVSKRKKNDSTNQAALKTLAESVKKDTATLLKKTVERNEIVEPWSAEEKPVPVIKSETPVLHKKETPVP